MEIELENYILEQELERDDLATVYQARRKSDNTAVAIKVLAPHFTFDEAFVRRFRDMARQAARLEHPNIIRTYEARQQGNILYVIQELISARSLDQILFNEGPFTPQRMVAIARQVASALDYAHQKSLTHGDLAVDRVYIGDHDHTIVTDFGQIQALVGTSLVKQGYAIGTPETIAPERVHGQGPTRQSDLYSLGVLCYQMLAGDPPFTGEPAAVLHAQAYEQPQPLHLVNPTISVALSETVGRMLAKGLELRYNTGSEFARALSVAIEGTAPVRAPVAAQRQVSSLTPTRTWWQRPAVWLPVLVLPAIILLLALGFGVVSLWNSLAATFTAATPTPIAQLDSSPIIPTPTIIANTPTPTPVPVQLVSTSLPTNTPAPPTLTPTPTNTPTPVPLPTPGPPVTAPNSPFDNIVLARGLTDDSEPRNVGTSFAPGSEPVYVFFDYTNMETNTPWTHRWTWGDTELDVYTEPWAESYADAGTAWVFYKPAEEGFQPGPYKVTLEVEGQVVATATFIIEAGGLE